MTAILGGVLGSSRRGYGWAGSLGLGLMLAGHVGSGSRSARVLRFCGSDMHAEAAAAIFSVIASCRLHGLDPFQYLEEILRVLPYWPRDRYLELAPKYWPPRVAASDPRSSRPRSPSSTCRRERLTRSPRRLPPAPTRTRSPPGAQRRRMRPCATIPDRQAPARWHVRLASDRPPCGVSAAHTKRAAASRKV